MKRILISTIALLMIVTLVGCGKDNNNQNEGIEKIENTKLNEEQNLDGLEFSNDTITFDGSNTEFVSTVKNTTNQTQKLTWVKAKVKYEDSNKIERDVELLIYFGEEIPAGEVRTTTTVVDTDLRKTLDVEYEIER